MYVVKRDGRQEAVHFDKITARLKKLSYGLSQDHCDPVLVAQKVCAGVYKGVTTSQLDELAAETAAALTASHPDYASLAARIAVSNLHKNTMKSFSETVNVMYTHVNERTGLRSPLIADDVYEIIMKNATRLDSEIIYDRDFDYDFFGFKTLERSYLLKVGGMVVERPQHMLMRVSVGIHKEDIDSAVKTYHMMSQRWFTHASPTLFNAGTPRPQLSSCFLICMKDDSIEGIYDTLSECASISKSAGGIGVSIHNVRATGSYIRGTNGTSNGIVPMLRVFNDTARYVDQGGGKRKGAFAIYLEPWHADIFEFLDLRKNHGKEENRARDLFYALWIPDLFMERVQSNEQWSLFCPSEAPGLADCWGDEFKNLYKKYEREGKAKKIVSAQSLWFDILKAQIETGTPYMLYKDSCNRKSNQQNLGTIKSSNLCTEIIEYTSPTETAVCNLASIALPRFVREKGVPIESHPAKLVGSIGSKNRYFDFDKLAEITSLVTWNLNKIIDVNYYPVETARKSNMRHRPIGIGVQGLADTFILLGMPFESPEAQQLNKDIFETIYYHALKASAEIAAKEGPYETYVGSPVSKEAYVALNMMTEIGSLPTIQTYNSLANVFAKGGLFQEAEAIFSRMTNSAGIQKNKDSFDALIEAYCQGSQLDDAVKAYMEMRKSRFNPDEHSLEGVLNAYCIAGVIDEIKEQFEEIKSDMTVPSIIAYCMMLSLYARNDRWADAYDLLEEMKSYRDSNTHQVIASMIKGEYDDSSNWQMVEYVLDSSNLEGCDYSLRFFNALLDVLWWFGQKARAERVLEHAVNYGLFPELSCDTKLVWSLDVHRMSVGGALVAVSVWLNKLYTRLKAEKDLPQLASVVVLRGKMEKSTITRGLPIAKVVYSFLNDTLSSSFHYPKWNKGRIICLKSQLKKLQAAIDSSNGAAIPGFVHMTDSRLPSPGSKIYTPEPQVENGSAHSTAESSVEEKESELLAL